MDQLQGFCVAAHGIMVFGSYKYPYLGCYTMQDTVPVKRWEDVYYDSFYAVKNDLVKFSKTLTKGSLVSLHVSPRYVYAAINESLLSDYDIRKVETSSANVIFVFDHQGNRIGRLKLDAWLDAICVSEDDRMLYGITEVPDYSIVTFDLPQW